MVFGGMVPRAARSFRPLTLGYVLTTLSGSLPLRGVWYIITHQSKYFKQYFYFIPTFYKKNIPTSPAEQKRSRKSEAKMDDRINSPAGEKALKEP